MDVIMLQTSDPEVYKPILDLTQRVNLLYCKRQRIAYECYIGVKKGMAAWQATYNRYFMLSELVARGFAGWVMYLDADAFVVDLDFDIRAYLGANSGYCLIGALAGEEAWSINAGVFFLNLGDPEGRQLVDDYLDRFNKTIPASSLSSRDVSWLDELNQGRCDQAMLHACIDARPALMAKTKKEEWGLFNYWDGKFIRQALRQMLPDFSARLDWIRAETERIIADRVDDPRIAPAIPRPSDQAQ